MSTVTFVVDVSNHNTGLTLRSVLSQGYEACYAKATEGANFKDALFHGYANQATALGMLFAPYHFLHSDSAISAQVENYLSQVHDKRLPGILDVEPVYQGSKLVSAPGLKHAEAFRAMVERHGYTMPTVYYSREWWTQTGKPNLTGWHVINAAYPNSAHEYGSVLWQQVQNDGGFNPYGGKAPDLWQFTGNGKITGYPGPVDMNVFPGTRSALAALGVFHDYRPSVPAVAGQGTGKGTTGPDTPPSPSPTLSEQLYKLARATAFVAGEVKSHGL